MNNAVKACIAYLGTIFTGVYFLITEKNNDFVRKNAAQAFTLGALGLLLCAIVKTIPFLGGLLYVLTLLLFLALWVFSILKSLNRVYYRLPFISDISEKYVVKWFIFR